MDILINLTWDLPKFSLVFFDTKRILLIISLYWFNDWNKNEKRNKTIKVTRNYERVIFNKKKKKKSNRKY